MGFPFWQPAIALRIVSLIWQINVLFSYCYFSRLRPAPTSSWRGGQSLGQHQPIVYDVMGLALMQRYSVIRIG